MTLSDFLAQSRFSFGFASGRQSSFAFSAAAELVVFALAKTTQTASSSQCCRFAPLGFPKMLKLLWLKAPFARKPEQVHFYRLVYFSGWLGLISNGASEEPERAWLPSYL